MRKISCNSPSYTCRQPMLANFLSSEPLLSKVKSRFSPLTRLTSISTATESLLAPASSMVTSQPPEHDSTSGPAPPPESASQPANNAGAEDAERNAAVVEPEPKPEYVTGVKLVILVATVGFASLIMMLDLMIVSTVGCVIPPPIPQAN